MKVEPIISEQLSHQMCLSNHNVHIFDSPNMTFDFGLKVVVLCSMYLLQFTQFLFHLYRIIDTTQWISKAKYAQKSWQKHVQIRWFGPYVEKDSYICDRNSLSNDVNA